MNHPRRGAADPKVLSLLIILGGFIGVFALYGLEPWLIPPPPPPPVDRNAPPADALKPEELQEMYRYLKAEIAGLEADLAPVDAALKGPLEDLLAELAPSGDGFACGRIDAGRNILQERSPRLVYIRDWLKENARRAPDPDTRTLFNRLFGDVDGLVKMGDRAILGFQMYQTAPFPKAAENALKKLVSSWKGYSEGLKRLTDQTSKL